MLKRCTSCGARFASKLTACIFCGHALAPLHAASDKKLYDFSGDVGFITPGCFEVGGVETWHESLIPNLRSVSGYVAVHPGSARGISDRRFGCKTASGLDAARALCRASKVLVVWNSSDVLNQIAPQNRDCKIVLMNHADGSNYWTNEHIKKSLVYADRIVSICPSARDATPEGFRPVLIPNAPDPKRLQVHNALQKPSRRLAIAIARFSKEKRLHILAEAFGRHLPDHELWLIGSPNGLESPDLPSYENVKILPPTQTPGDYYAIADLAVSASEEEGYGLSSAEALLAGLPLVSTQVGFLEQKPELATIVAKDASLEDWASAIRSAQPKPTSGLDRFEDFVATWQGMIDLLVASPRRDHAKMAICRSNRCGKYVAEKDACQILLDRGGAGQIGWLQNNQHAKCVDDPPQFIRDLPVDSPAPSR